MGFPTDGVPDTVRNGAIAQLGERLNGIQEVVGNIDAGRAVERPFFHLAFDRVFPDDVYAEMIAAMPAAADYRPLPGRNNGNIREDGTSTRVQIYLFPEYLRHLAVEKL